MTELPIACSLTADEMPARLAEMASVGRDALDSADADGTRAVLRFRRHAGTRDRLAAIVAAESECCAFLVTELVDEAQAVVLTIEAPQGAEPVLDQLVEAFGGSGAAAS
jgi:hypothetical protein